MTASMPPSDLARCMRTTSTRNSRCQSPPLPAVAAMNPGSRLSSTSGRQISASTGSVTLATPAIPNSAASSTASTLPNRICVRSRLCCVEISATPAASASRYMPASWLSSRPPVRRASHPATTATAKPATTPPSPMAQTDRPAAMAPTAIPGRTPCCKTSLMRLMRRSTRKTPSGGAETDKARHPAKARRIKPSANGSRRKSSIRRPVAPAPASRPSGRFDWSAAACAGSVRAPIPYRAAPRSWCGRARASPG
ncbi:hypothetical protein GALL_508090 [mine drainage metagenome]|uniref:Uncharacterized protein n=1 Tax=mine drainage metagenome TaxID=410659 RepID=A0A1J5P8T2_9ZZZZ